MIGRVQDMVSAAVVIGAADRAAASSGAQQTETAQQQNAAVQESAKAVSPMEEGMQKDNPNDASAEKQKEREAKMDEKAVSFMTEELNDLMSRIDCNLQFTYHKEVDVMSVAMIDKNTNEVLKELPPEEMIDNMMKAKEWIGAFLDKNA